MCVSTLLNCGPFFPSSGAPSINTDQRCECNAPQGWASTSGDKSRAKSPTGKPHTHSKTGGQVCTQKCSSIKHKFTQTYTLQATWKSYKIRGNCLPLFTSIYLCSATSFLHEWCVIFFCRCHSWVAPIYQVTVCRQLSWVWAISCHHNVGDGWAESLHPGETDVTLNLPHTRVYCWRFASLRLSFSPFAINPMPCSHKPRDM